MKNDAYNAEQIGKRIRQARQAKRFTQSELSEQIHMNPKTLTQLERGKIALSITSLINLCKALTVSADYILFGEQNEQTNGTVGILLSELSEKEQVYAENLLSFDADASNSLSKYHYFSHAAHFLPNKPCGELFVGETT